MNVDTFYYRTQGVGGTNTIGLRSTSASSCFLFHVHLLFIYSHYSGGVSYLGGPFKFIPFP